MAFGAAVFCIGTIAFLVVDQSNRSLRDELLSTGIRTEGAVLATSDTPERVMNQTSFRWQYLSTYTVRFTYQHDGIGWVDVETTTTEDVYDSAVGGAPLDVVYLADEPGTARLLDDGRVSIPNLRVFVVLSALLLAGALWELARSFGFGRGRPSSRVAPSVMAFVYRQQPLEVDRSDPLASKYRSWAPLDAEDRDHLTQVYRAPDDPGEVGTPTDIARYWSPDFPITLGRFPNHGADIHRSPASGNLFLLYQEFAGHHPEWRCRFLDPGLISD